MLASGISRQSVYIVSDAVQISLTAQLLCLLQAHRQLGHCVTHACTVRRHFAIHLMTLKSLQLQARAECLALLQLFTFPKTKATIVALSMNLTNDIANFSGINPKNGTHRMCMVIMLCVGLQS
jgi:hypothetical protein